MGAFSKIRKNEEETGLGDHFSLDGLYLRYLSNFKRKLEAVGYINIEV